MAYAHKGRRTVSLSGQGAIGVGVAAKCLVSFSWLNLYKALPGNIQYLGNLFFKGSVKRGRIASCP